MSRRKSKPMLDAANEWCISARELHGEFTFYYTSDAKVYFEKPYTGNEIGDVKSIYGKMFALRRIDKDIHTPFYWKPRMQEYWKEI